MSGIDVVVAIFWGALALGCFIFLAREAWRQLQDWRLGRRLKRLERAQRELAEGIERWREAWQPVFDEIPKVVGKAFDEHKRGATVYVEPGTEHLWAEAGFNIADNGDTRFVAFDGSKS